MLTREEVEKIICRSAEAIIDEKNIDMKTSFIGPNSNFESIDIVQIVSEVEDQLEAVGFDSIDLFDLIFEVDSLTFIELAELVLANL